MKTINNILEKLEKEFPINKSTHKDGNIHYCREICFLSGETDPLKKFIVIEITQLMESIVKQDNKHK